MARCPGRNKFVSLDQSDPEVDASVNGDTVDVNARLVLTCAECGSELLEAEVEGSFDIEHDCEDANYEVNDTTAEATDRYQDKDRHGKPIKSFRYTKHFYGASETVVFQCSKCEQYVDVPFDVEEQSSFFSEM